MTRISYKFATKDQRKINAGSSPPIAGYLSEEQVENDFASFVFDGENIVFWRNLSENTLVATNDYAPGFRDRHYYLAGEVTYEKNRYGKMKNAYERFLKEQGFVIYEDVEC